MTRWADRQSDPQYLARVGHTLGGATLILVTHLFWGMSAWPWALGLGVLAAALKGFGYDSGITYLNPAWGEGDSWADSAMDFAFYVIGRLEGMDLLLLAAWVHS